MELELTPYRDRPAWAALVDREDLPHEIAQARDTLERIPIDRVTAEKVTAWIGEQGWTGETTPIRVEPASSGPSNPSDAAT